MSRTQHLVVVVVTGQVNLHDIKETTRLQKVGHNSECSL